jgi:hypothetical protein
MSYRWVKWHKGGRYVDNDEGYHYKYCCACRKETEHGITEGCIECSNKNLSAKKRH